MNIAKETFCTNFSVLAFVNAKDFAGDNEAHLPEPIADTRTQAERCYEGGRQLETLFLIQTLHLQNQSEVSVVAVHQSSST